MKLKFTLFFIVCYNAVFAQSAMVAHQRVDTLSSAYFWGRGYTHNGVNKAAGYIISQFKSFGLVPMDGRDFLQPFTFNVNTFPGKMELSINGKVLKPGIDFIVGPESRGVHAESTLVQKDSVDFVDYQNSIGVSIDKKLTWSVNQQAADYTTIHLDKKSITDVPKTININIENKVIKNFKTGNICALVKGTSVPDSVILLTAHYDHLGGMGADTYFPGANDNGSGTSMILGLAQYYAAHPQRYTMAFVCFAGEEAGLLGSKYFTQNSLILLKQIRFLINFDMVGTGAEGITAVNATVYPKEFALLKQLNDDGHYLANVHSRGKAANSDHYWFTEKGVPAFFIYTEGGIRAYHDVFDRGATLPLSAFENLFNLIVKFNAALM